MTKAELRKVFLSRRQTLTSQGAAHKSVQIAHALLSSHQYHRARVFSLYSSIKGEVSTDEIFRAAKTEGKIVLFPKVIGDGLEFFPVEDLKDLRPGRFGVLEPEDTSAFPLKAIEMIVVPGVAFDTYGNRLGYGKGYFDSVLRCSPRPAAVALAFECQIYDGVLPADSGDASVDMVLTEKRAIGGILPEWDIGNRPRVNRRGSMIRARLKKGGG